MASSDHDDDLKLALALSMQQSPARGSAEDTIDLTSDNEAEDDGDDMRRAIALSLQAARRSNSPKVASVSKHVPEQAMPYSPTTITQTRPFAMAGIDRKAMEAERLARLGKRKRERSPDLSSKQTADVRATQTTKSSQSKPALPHNEILQYPKGAIKRTFAKGYPRTDDITIDEVLQANTLNIAVISSFMWDAEWLNKKLSPITVKQIWIMNAKGQDVQQRWHSELKEAGYPSTLRIHFPPMDGVQNMHSKLMLLFGRDKLRVVVPTANITPFDWGEVNNDWQPGVMENSVFLVDLPRRRDDSEGVKNELTAFGQHLVGFLEKQQLDQKVIEGVLKFDFSETTHLAFVHAIGGSHKGDLQQPTGLPGLAKAVRDLGLDDVKAIELEYASASLGAINDNFLQRLYLAAQGEAFTTGSAANDVRKHIRIYFPTDDTVDKSVGGPDCAGIIALSRQFYNAATFPKECLRDYDSTRRGMLSHNKLLFARGTKKNGKPFAWVYTGSANMSESAWGGQKVLKSGQMGSLNVRNWECGVVMAVPDDRMADLNDAVPPMSVFGGTVEVPFVYPGRAYGDRAPWFFPRG